MLPERSGAWFFWVGGQLLSGFVYFKLVPGQKIRAVLIRQDLNVLFMVASFDPFCTRSFHLVVEGIQSRLKFKFGFSYCLKEK